MKEDDFYLEDYELRVRYFTDQLGRMWQRFNYFLVLETALFGGKIYTEKDLELKTGFVVLGLFISVCWYVMGSEDRYLVRVYRKSIENAFERIKNNLGINTDYWCTGEIELYKNLMKAENSKNNWVSRLFNGWRISDISTTRLAAIIPFLLILAWVGVLIFH